MTPLAIGGTILWLVAAVVLTFLADEFTGGDKSWWVDCAWWGFAMGIPGTIVMVIHDRGRPRPSDQDVASSPAVDD